MPFLVTTTTPSATALTANGRDLERHERRGSVRVSSLAFDTLGEAQWHAAEELALANSTAEGTVPSRAFTPSERAEVDDAIGAGGGAITLCDGSTITVRPE